MAFNTPILLIVYNRPDVTERVFERIAILRPTTLFIAADGPNIEKADDIANCKQVRSILQKIDWDCNVETLFHATNLGCKKAVSEAINWFFKFVEQGIILEDDTLPDDSFFTFCQEMLEYYKNDPRTMHIGGVNFQFGQKRGNESYYFSKYCHIWGWATWKRAWNFYSVGMDGYQDFKIDNKVKQIFKSEEEQQYWIKIFDAVHNGQIDTWDFQWFYTIWKCNGLCIVPNVNLISNIGFGKDATHTKSKDNTANMKVGKLVELQHPKFVGINEEADLFTFKNVIKRSPPKRDILQYILKKIKILNRWN